MGLVLFEVAPEAAHIGRMQTKQDAQVETVGFRVDGPQLELAFLEYALKHRDDSGLISLSEQSGTCQQT